MKADCVLDIMLIPFPVGTPLSLGNSMKNIIYSLISQMRKLKFAGDYVAGFGEGNGTPLQIFLPGKSHGQRSLVGSSPWGR